MIEIDSDEQGVNLTRCVRRDWNMTTGINLRCRNSMIRITFLWWALPNSCVVCNIKYSWWRRLLYRIGFSLGIEDLGDATIEDILHKCRVLDRKSMKDLCLEFDISRDEILFLCQKFDVAFRPNKFDKFHRYVCLLSKKKFSKIYEYEIHVKKLSKEYDKTGIAVSREPYEFIKMLERKWRNEKPIREKEARKREEKQERERERWEADWRRRREKNLRFESLTKRVSDDKERKQNKSGIIDFIYTTSSIRCPTCDGRMEGGPGGNRRHYCPECAQMFDSHGNAV